LAGYLCLLNSTVEIVCNWKLLHFTLHPHITSLCMEGPIMFNMTFPYQLYYYLWLHVEL